MSASLVGSEMCIRDRHYAEQLLRGLLKSESLGVRVISYPGYRCDVAAEAVSYTHLTLPTICSV
eukprot:4553290-Alexandrium_andersonii.AAC.1